MALLHLLRVCDKRLGLGLRLAALHVDYGLRGAESDRDRRLVEEACAAVGVPLCVERPATTLHGPGLQNRARALRYDLARALSRQHGYTRIVTAHNRDDQAETVLYRLVKYPSPYSLVGMPALDGLVVRPLLCLSASEVRAYCRARAIRYGVDGSNSYPVYARNHLRLRVLPELERINPRVAEGLADAAAAARAEQDLIERLAAEAWERVRVADDGLQCEPASRDASPILDIGALRTEHPALRTACLRRFLRCAVGARTLGDRQRLSALERLLAGPASARVALPGGWEAVREGSQLCLRAAIRHTCPPTAVEVAAGTSTQAVFCGLGYRLSMRRGSWYRRESGDAWIGLSASPGRVVLRHPRRGERFDPLGAGGSITVLQFLADHGVPRAERERTLVVEVDGGVAWVGGRVAQSRRVSESTVYTLHICREVW